MRSIEPGISRFRVRFAPRNDSSMPRPKNLPRFGRACNLAARAPRASGNRLDQLPVRGHLGAISQIESILKPGAEMPAEIGAALVQRPYFTAADRSHLPMRFR